MVDEKVDYKEIIEKFSKNILDKDVVEDKLDILKECLILDHKLTNVVQLYKDMNEELISKTFKQLITLLFSIEKNDDNKNKLSEKLNVLCCIKILTRTKLCCEIIAVEKVLDILYKTVEEVLDTDQPTNSLGILMNILVGSQKTIFAYLEKKPDFLNFLKWIYVSKNFKRTYFMLKFMFYCGLSPVLGKLMVDAKTFSILSKFVSDTVKKGNFKDIQKGHEDRQLLSMIFQIYFMLLKDDEKKSLNDHLSKEEFDSLADSVVQILSVEINDEFLETKNINKVVDALPDDSKIAISFKEGEKELKEEREKYDKKMKDIDEELIAVDKAPLRKRKDPNDPEEMDPVKEKQGKLKGLAQRKINITKNHHLKIISLHDRKYMYALSTQTEEEKSLYNLHCHISHALLTLPNTFTGLLLEKVDSKEDESVEKSVPLRAFLRIFERKSANPKELTSVVPILMILKGIVLSNRKIRQYVKQVYFGVKQETGKDMMSAIVTLKDSHYKTKLIKWITSFHFELKNSVSEFLYGLCGNKSEDYIKLVGFGNAVGLLAEKGLPGFSHLKQNAISFDQLARMSKAGKKL